MELCSTGLQVSVYYTTYSFVRVFLDKETGIDEDIANCLQAALEFCDGALVYQCENLTAADPNNYDLSNYDFRLEF